MTSSPLTLCEIHSSAGEKQARGWGDLAAFGSCVLSFEVYSYYHSIITLEGYIYEYRSPEHEPRPRSRFGAPVAAVEGSVSSADGSRHAALGAAAVCSDPPDLCITLRPPIGRAGDVYRLLRSRRQRPPAGGEH